jgi:regulator of PEP synthase PpsR (kinase-PPPase family)
MSPSRLRELRLARATYLGTPADAYTALPKIREEIRYSQHLAVRHRWRQIDVTGKSVEEVAREVALLLPGQREGRYD